MIEPDLFRLSFHPLESHSGMENRDVAGHELSVTRKVVLKADFGIELNDFAEKLTARFDASYEYDGSFAFFLESEPVSGQLVGAGKKLNVVELFNCTQAKSLSRFVELFGSSELIIQILELGVFVTVDELKRVMTAIDS